MHLSCGDVKSLRVKTLKVFFEDLSVTSGMLLVGIPF
jgi:hypothetical protein